MSTRGGKAKKRKDRVGSLPERSNERRNILRSFFCYSDFPTKKQKSTFMVLKRIEI